MNKSFKVPLIAIVVLVLVGVLAIAAKVYSERQDNAITSYEDCARAGYPILESYPEQCVTPRGKHFTRDLNKIVPPEQVACTLEAKICPDGSSVGRTGPNCEFAPCPN